MNSTSTGRPAIPPRSLTKAAAASIVVTAAAKNGAAGRPSGSTAALTHGAPDGSGGLVATTPFDATRASPPAHTIAPAVSRRDLMLVVLPVALGHGCPHRHGEVTDQLTSVS